MKKSLGGVGDGNDESTAFLLDRGRKYFSQGNP